MNPELLKQLQAMIAQFRNAAVGSTDKLTQPFADFGKGQGEFGMDMARNINAIAHSTNAHPAPKNAGLNTILGIGSLFVPGLEGEGAAERPALAAAIKTPEGKIVDDVTHAHAYMKAGITEPLKPKFEGFTDKNIPNSFYTRQQAEKLMKSWTSQSVKNQMATRSQQAGRDMGMTTEDVNGKLYANRGTRADEPMTLDDMNRIMRNKKRREGRASLDSAAVVPLETLLSRAQARRENVAQNWGDKRRPFEDRVADQNTIAVNAAAAKARLHPETALPPDEAQLQANADAYNRTKGFGRKPITPKRLAQFNQDLGNQPFAPAMSPEEAKIQANADAYKARRGVASLDSAVVHPLADLVRKEGKVGQLGDNDVVIDFRGKKYYGSDGQTSAYQDALSKIPHELPGPRRTMLQPGEPVPPFWGTRLHSQLTQDGGFTIDPNTGENLTSGYSVGGGNKAGILLKKPLADLKPTELQDFLNQNKSKLAPGQAWGGWVDNGHVYIEPADQVADRAAATKLGQQRGEKAIWDHANKSEIPTQNEAPRAAMDSVAIPAAQEFHHVLTKWQSAFKDFNALGAEVHAEPNLRRSELANALRQRDIPRPEGNPAKQSEMEDIAYKTYTGKKFSKLVEQGRGTGLWYDTNPTLQGAIDALGPVDGPKAFHSFINHVGATTAMSDPMNNAMRASWWKALSDKGLLDPEMLKTHRYEAPDRFGHIANKAHHFAMSDLLKSGSINVLNNPKPGGFVQNLLGNWRPFVDDTQMATAAYEANPKMKLGLDTKQQSENGITTATPKKWAYGPMERAFQRAAEFHQSRGAVDDIPGGMDPTAAAQSQVWHAYKGVGPQDYQSFSQVVSRLLDKSAKLWGVTPTKANELFWKGQPLDLPLDASLLKGITKRTKK